MKGLFIYLVNTLPTRCQTATTSTTINAELERLSLLKFIQSLVTSTTRLSLPNHITSNTKKTKTAIISK